MNTKNSFRCPSIAILLAGVVVAVLASGAIASPIILNNSFESPDAGTPTGNYHEGTPPTSWTEVGSGGGYIGNGSAYGNSNAPDGTQALLLKSQGGVSQVLSGFTAGVSYDISFYAEARTNFNGPNPIQVLVDSNPLTFGGNSTITPTAGQDSYALFTSDRFVATSATPLLSFIGQSSGDNSSFVDNVRITALNPEPSSFVLGGLGVVGLFVVARRRRKA